MEVQWCGGEPLKLGPPHSAVGIALTLLLGNVTALWSSAFNLPHLHYLTAGMHNFSTSAPPRSLNFSLPSSLKPDCLFWWDPRCDCMFELMAFCCVILTLTFRLLFAASAQILVDNTCGKVSHCCLHLLRMIIFLGGNFAVSKRRCLQTLPFSFCENLKVR